MNRPGGAIACTRHTSIAPIKKAPGGALYGLISIVINQGGDYAR